MNEHPKPWWYKLAERLVPDRCREIPEAQNPNRIVLRQVALVKRYAYLQQFASGEDTRFMHSHQWRRMIAIGLWGGYLECRLKGWGKRRSAPYFYTFDDSLVHHVQEPTPGHTSIFIGLWRDDNMKFYYDFHSTQDRKVLWSDHIKKMVKRI